MDITATIKNIGTEDSIICVPVSYSDGTDEVMRFALDADIDAINLRIATALKKKNLEVSQIEDLKPYIGTVIEQSVNADEVVVKAPGKSDVLLSTELSAPAVDI